MRLHPLLNILGKSTDPAAKMSALTSMQSSEIDELMTLLIVIAQQDSGELLNSLREQVAQENERAAPGSSSAMSHIIRTMGSLANMQRVGAAHGMPGHVHGPDCPHHHGHGHHHGAHGHGHGHHHGGMMGGVAGNGGHYAMGMAAQMQSNVASGKGAEMDR